MRFQFLLIFSLLLSIGIKAQPLPNTNIMLFDFDQKSDSVYSFDNPKFLTNFNKEGYNNQPYFMSDNELYISVQFPKDTTQTDIYALNVNNKKMTQITSTIESEYSPTFVPPGGTSKSFEFSCIRVETDGSQRLWRFPMDRSGKGAPVFQNLVGIGYHFWINYRDLVLLVVDEPHKMLAADSRDESARFVTNNIGRCFQELPDGSVAFTEKLDENTWLLKKMDSRSYRTSLITATLSGSEDFVVLRDGTIIMANGNKLYKFNQKKDTTWREIANLSYYGMRSITRLAVNAAENKVAIVIN